MIKEMTFVIVAALILNSCCQQQGVPVLRPMPTCSQQQQPELMIPVTPDKK